MQKRRLKVALTGASGYIGKNLLSKITNTFDVIALSRNVKDKANTEHVSWRECDFFSLKDAQVGLSGADIAIYLIHSMKPSAKMTQAEFQDMDVILADNFARAAQKNGVKQIIYLSGIIPEHNHLSRHLKSRLEVEKILKSSGIPVTTIRAGLIVGPKGSSFPILSKLVQRLPVMLLPKWTRTKTHPIALEDVLHSLVKTVDNDDVKDRSIDVGGPEVMSYKNMLIQTAEVMNKKPRLFNIPLLTVNLSRLWVTLITGAPKETAYPLIESLKHPMVAKKENRVEGISDGKTSFKTAAVKALEYEHNPTDSIIKKLKKSVDQPDVRSIQRVQLPDGKNANWAGAYYMHWISSLAKFIVKSEVDADRHCKIFLKPLKSPILELAYLPERSDSTRALYRISGGLFTRITHKNRGRLEFRQIPNSRELLIAIHEYQPSLPWAFYKYTQAKIHLWVMYLFKKHLQHYIESDDEQHIQTSGTPSKHHAV
ncbi:NAD(P)H-binding protein [Sediminibacillus massiliensis]|uniref:NAD(P)H-binding protein n=1 Tax=Sediminibacillus massiliensis TaxID=1926277 RepID=UPI0009883DB5|nr:NAD(P)H-binding protein [Sediminibacillus massiliensis]